MPLSSLLLEVSEENKDKIADLLSRLKGVEIHSLDFTGKIILTTETERMEEDRALNEALEKFPGVLSCRVVFNHFEDCTEEAP